MAYRASALRGLAVAQMVFGALMIVFGAASIFAVNHWSSYVGYGIWVGIWVSKNKVHNTVSIHIIFHESVKKYLAINS